MKRLALVLLRSCVVLALGLAAHSQDSSSPSVVFTKEFPGSQPDYYSIAVQENGTALYRTAPDEKPTEFQITESSAQQIFSLAQKLNLFRGVQVESGRKVAKMGKKTFAYDAGNAHNEVSFNHTENPNATALLSFFERLATTMQHRDRLEYLVRFDRLGIVKELLQLETDLDGGRLLEANLLAPQLEKIQSNKALVNVAHERAAGILTKLHTTSQ